MYETTYFTIFEKNDDWDSVTFSYGIQIAFLFCFIGLGFSHFSENEIEWRIIRFVFSLFIKTKDARTQGSKWVRSVVKTTLPTRES